MTTTTYHAQTSTIDHITALVCGVRPAWDTAELLPPGRPRGPARHGTSGSASSRPSHWKGLATEPAAVALIVCRVCGKTEDRCHTERPGRDDDHAFEPGRRAR